MYHHLGSTSIFRPLSYPFRSHILCRNKINRPILSPIQKPKLTLTVTANGLQTGVWVMPQKIQLPSQISLHSHGCLLHFSKVCKAGCLPNPVKMITSFST